jgi:hypothetical protein
VLEDKNIDPALMIAVDEIPTPVGQTVDALHIPPGFLGQAHPSAVTGYPVCANAVQDMIEDSPYRFDGQGQFQQGEDKYDCTPENDIQREQQG